MSLNTLYLMPTLNCNCSCDYCYIPEQKKINDIKPHIMEQALANFITELNEKKKRDEPQLRFIGGEPYLAPELLIKLSQKFAAAFPNKMIVINSNGTLITEQNATQLKKTDAKIIHIISLDGLENIHCEQRKLNSGDNSFRSAINGIKILKKQSLPVYCNMVIHKQTEIEINHFFNFIKNELKMDALSVSLLSSKSAPLSNKEKLNKISDCYKIAQKHKLQLSGHHRLLLGEKIKTLYCQAGTKTVVVAPDGSCYPCQRFVGKPIPQLLNNKNSNKIPINDQAQVASCCYNKANKELGAMLYELYFTQYPEYLSINALDKILFGVL